MPRYDELRDDPNDHGRLSSPRRSRSARRTSARKIVLRTAWLRYPLVYWAGAVPEERPGKAATQAAAVYRPIANLIAARLAGLPAGVYALPLRYDWREPSEAVAPDSGAGAEASGAEAADDAAPGAEDASPRTEDSGAALPSPAGPVFEPRIPEAIRVAETAFVDAVRAWTQAADYPRALPELVGDLDTWRAGVGARIHEVSQALRAAALSGTASPVALGVEAHCLWVGPDAERPSRRLPTAAIAEWLLRGEGVAADESTQRLAALVLGQRRADRGLPASLSDWSACGRILAAWPPDVLMQTASRASGRPAALARALPQEPGVATCAFEVLLAAPDKDPLLLLAALGSLLRAVEIADREPRRRRAALIALLDEAVYGLPAVAQDRRLHGGRLHKPDRWLKDLHLAVKAAYTDAHVAEVRLPPVEIKRAESGVVELTEWVTGCSLQASDVSPWLKDFARSSAPMASLGDAFAAHFLRSDIVEDSDAAVWQAVACGLVGRWAAFGDAQRLPGALADWLDACRLAIRPAGSADGVLSVAIDAFAAALHAGAAAPGGSERTLDLVARHGVELFPDMFLAMRLADARLFRASRKWQTVLTPESVRSRLLQRTALLGRLAARGLTSCGPAFALGLGELLDRAAGSVPAAIPRFVAALASDPDHPLRVDFSQQERRHWWPSLRVWALDDAVMSRWLWDWTCSLVARHGIDWGDACDMLDEVLSFCLYSDGGWGFANARSGDRLELHPDRSSRQAFLAQHAEILEDLLADAIRSTAIINQAASGEENEESVDLLFVASVDVLNLVYLWQRDGGADVARLVRALRQSLHQEALRVADQLARARAAGNSIWLHTPSLPGGPNEYPLAIALSGGEPQRVPPLLQVIASRPHPRQSPEPAHAGWRYLSRQPQAQARLAALAGRNTELAARVVDLLERVALTVRFPARRDYDSALAVWLSPDPPAGLPLPSGCPPALAATLWRLAAYRGMAGLADPFGADIRALLDQDAAMHRELEVLEARHAAGGLSPSAATRLTKLHKLRDAPEQQDSLVRSRLAKRAAKLADYAELAALEMTVQRVIDSHWTPILGSPPPRSGAHERSWDNALSLFYRLGPNKALLRRLLRSIAQDTFAADLAAHPANQAFARRAGDAGIDMAAWLAPFDQTYRVHGEPWRVYVATDPLEVLQMGNLFNTCLSVDQDNAFATVANAFEINKRVLYVRNRKGHVIGRKLVVLSADGLLFGFRSYGTGAHWDQEDYPTLTPWIKIILDQYCLALAECVGARLAGGGAIKSPAPENLALFAKWYFDGFAPFDPWLLGTPPDLGADARWWQGFQEAHVLHRYLVYLGDAALPALQAIPPQEGEILPVWRWVARHTESEAVRALIGGWGSAAGEG